LKIDSTRLVQQQLTAKVSVVANKRFKQVRNRPETF